MAIERDVYSVRLRPETIDYIRFQKEAHGVSPSFLIEKLIDAHKAQCTQKEIQYQLELKAS